VPANAASPRSIVLIPTYNEAESLPIVVAAVLDHSQAGRAGD
jgi:glycosyltransferase involved in cell wall biosynthesis